MRAFLHRYELDRSRPSVAGAGRDLARRALLPAVALWAAVVGLGLIVVGPLGSLPGEASLNRDLVEAREPGLDTATSVVSNVGGTEFIVLGCAVVVAAVWWRTREWWFAVVPALAVGLQALVFVTAAAVVDRERPDVLPLDEAPPTSGFPSGHSGAAAAFYVVLAMLAQRLRRPVLRRAVTGLCLAVPLAVATARLYRGMHGATDVLVGLLNGLVCVWLAWRYLRRRPGAQTRA